MKRQGNRKIDDERDDEMKGDNAGVEECLTLNRRKLLEKVMDGFVIGNTNARRVWSTESETPSKDTVKVLYVGVGDMRNALATLVTLESKKQVHFVLNDMASLTLARNIVLLRTSETDIESAVSLWSDARLSNKSFQLLRQVLDSLLQPQNECQWLGINDQPTLTALKAHWSAWFNECRGQLETGTATRKGHLAEMRTSILRSTKHAGHGRVGSSTHWVESGVTSMSRATSKGFQHSNPLVFDLLGSEPRLVDMQGPFGAFRELEKCFPGGTTFAQTVLQCWSPLLKAFTNRVMRGSIKVEVVLGDCMRLLDRGILGDGFDAIDTSNVMDYVGLWNLLLVCEKRLSQSPDAFIFTEQIMGVSTDIEGLFCELAPFDPILSKVFARLIGLDPRQTPPSLRPSDAEKVVHVRWFRHFTQECDWDLTERDATTRREAMRRLTSVIGKERLAKLNGRLSALWPQELEQVVSLCEEAQAAGVPQKVALKEMTAFLDEIEDASKAQDAPDPTIAQFQTACFGFMQNILIPQPMSPAMIQSIAKVIDSSYPMPLSTVATFVRLLLRIADSPVGARLAQGILDTFFLNPNLHSFPHVRNRTLALRGLCQRYATDLKARGLFSNPDVIFNESEPLVYRQVVVKPFNDLLVPRGGILEPALAILLCETQASEQRLLKRNTQWRDEDGEPLNLVFDLIGKSDTVQVLDNLSFTSSSNELGFFLPEQAFMGSYHSLVLIDIQQYRVLAEPVPLQPYQASESSTARRRQVKRRKKE